MRKLVTLLLLITIIGSAFAVERTNGSLNVPVGADVKVPVAGQIYQIGNSELPNVYDENTIIFEIENKYYYKGEHVSAKYQLILSGVTISNEIKKMPLGSEVKENEVIGTALSSPVRINIRSKEFDPYLADVANVPPEFEDDWYYFGIGMFLNTTSKFLSFQPIFSKTDEIDFWDYPDTLENLYTQALAPNADGKKVQFSSFPAFKVCLKTKLSAYPETRHQDTINEALLLSKYFKNCTHMLDYEFDGIPVRLYFQEGFEKYLKDEYTLNEDIYIFASVLLITNDRFFCYVRDFSLKSPDEIVDEKVERVKEGMTELDKKD